MHFPIFIEVGIITPATLEVRVSDGGEISFCDFGRPAVRLAKRSAAQRYTSLNRTFRTFPIFSFNSVRSVNSYNLVYFLKKP